MRRRVQLAIAVLLTAFGAPAVAQTPAAPALAACSTWGAPGALLYQDDFKDGLASWVPEYAAAPGSSITAENRKLTIDVAGGATVWFRHELAGNLLISYKRTVVMAGGRNDRLSDLNQFWMAKDPHNPDLFTRKGTFAEYDGLLLYYAGIGGNTNTTTRMRKYAGNGERVLQTEFTDKAHLLQPNRQYAIEIAVFDGCTRLRVDGETIFSLRDPEPLQSGYFGFRTTQSRQEIGDFKVEALKSANDRK